MTIFAKIFTLENMLFLVQCAKYSILLATASVIIGTLLGTLTAAAKISRRKFLRTIANLYIEFIRGTPMLLQLMIFFFGLPQLIPNYAGLAFSTQVMIAGVVGMSINSGAYSAELIRSGIESIDVGQWEAGKSLGMSHNKIMRQIILPQAFKRIIPPLVSEFIVLIKDSSLVSSIGATELLKGAQVLGSHYYNYMIPLFMAALVYLAMTLTVSTLAKQVEKSMKFYD
ncbi:Arginine transport system permease protein ArtQ [bioreactor metagenome]|uniref:Arginine transport system permease protein ArtQ n=1 Tax=bioreactor metagenome TaxID=1076179 RepID=A0A645AAB1_9ZZZZ|nr:amino acid ABC transporter permease [Erysipelotrichaceae bacterium]